MSSQISVDLNTQTLSKDFSKKGFATSDVQPNTVFEEYEGTRSGAKVEDAVAEEQDLELINYSDFSNFEVKDLVDEYKDMIARGEISKREATEILAGAMSMANAAFDDGSKAKNPDMSEQDFDNIFDSEKYEDMLDEMEDRGINSGIFGNYVGAASKWLSP